MVANADNIERIILKLVFDELIELAFMLEITIDAFKVPCMDRVGERHGNFEENSLLGSVFLVIQPVCELFIRLDFQDPEYSIISAYIKEEYNQDQYRSYLFQVTGFATDITNLFAISKANQARKDLTADRLRYRARKFSLIERLRVQDTTGSEDYSHPVELRPLTQLLQ